ncbi:MAG TPA: DedA family protein [Thermodesulfobacteriota bacterium]|nr:DedA family protein [Thermodesulfobacteriota bacterium]
MSVKEKTITAIIAHSPYVGLFSLLMLGGIGIPFFPEDATFILCGALIAASMISTLPALLVSLFAVVTADLIIFHLGKKYGRQLVTHPRLRRLLPPEKFLKLEERFRKKGVYFLIFGRQVIGVRLQVILVSGIMKMPTLKFVLADALTAFVTIAVWTAVGYGGGHGLHSLFASGLRAIHIFAA